MQQDVFGDDQPSNHSGYLIWQLANIRQRVINTELKQFDLTYPQFIVLSGIHWLNRNNNSVNQVKLIQFTKMDKSVVSNVLRNLEKREIVVREVDPIDTRAKTLKLNDAGQESLTLALDVIKRVDASFFNSKIDGISDLNKILQQLINDNEG